MKLLQERTADGYVFRTDLRLRPDPASTQIAISTAAALDYYESVGQNWERAAMIKARPCAGDIAAGEAFLKELAPFIWRKYLDFAAVADVHAMKRQIHAYRGHDEIAVEGHNIKLGRGGIREIEFFVQTQQLIAGGRHPELRGRETLATLDALAEGGWIDARRRATTSPPPIASCAWSSIACRWWPTSRPTRLPAEREALERFARFLGFADRDAFADALLEHLRKVQRHYATLFEDAPAAEAGRSALLFPPDADDRETLDKLADDGLPPARSKCRRWCGAGSRAAIRSLQERVRAHAARRARAGAAATSSRARQIPTRALIALRPLPRRPARRRAAVLAAAAESRSGRADRARARHRAAARRHPRAVYPQVMDAVIDPSFFGALPEDAELAAGLDRSLAQATLLRGLARSHPHLRARSTCS